MMLAALTGCTNASGSCDASTPTWTQQSAVALDSVQADSDLLLARQSPQLYSPWLDCSTISPANLALASSWLKNCIQNHQPCKDGLSVRPLPTRIINVSDPREPRLEDGLRRPQRYVTLSYMWGTRQRYVTTKANLGAHTTSLPLTQLPLTFKDAMYVTYMLGFQWLWIDALCIVQDSEEDRAREVGAMDEIYRCSTLTLFAASGQSVDAGLAVPRDPRWTKPCLLTLRTTLNGETVEGSSYVTIDSARRDSPDSPLYTRGWVLQEEVLAVRGLIFGSYELAWRCLCSNATESHPNCKGKVNTLRELGRKQYDQWRSYSGGVDGFDLLRMWIMKSDPVPDRTPWQRDNHFDHWYNMVSNFSRRELTYPSDVLPALSGLASAMVNMHHCTYLAGLWEEDLSVGLAWYITATRQDTVRHPILPEEGKEKNIKNLPSWSWISQYGSAARFRGWENNHTLVKHECLALTPMPGDVEDFETHPFEHVAKRSLSLTGRVKTALMINPNDDRRYVTSSERLGNEHARFVRLLRDPKSGEIVGQVALDEEPREGVPTPLLYCLLCTVREKYGKWQLTCLGILPTDLTQEEFTRVGLVFVHDQDWFGEFRLSSTLDGERQTRYDPRNVRTVRIL